MKERELPRSVWLDGRIVPAARARVSVFDRGFLYGDGFFETVRCYRGAPFALEEHLQRLARSAAFLHLPLPPVPWAAAVHKVLAANALAGRDASVRLTVTRGPAAPGLALPRQARPTVLLFALPIARSLARQQRQGIAVITVPALRSGALCAHKLVDYVPAILARTEATRSKAHDAIYTHDGFVGEATTANVFAVLDNTLVTPPTNSLLPGVTRALVLSLAATADIPTAERPVPMAELYSASEVFLTSAVVEVLPVVRVDNTIVGGGKPGTLTRSLQQLYRQRVEQTLARERSK